MRHLHNAVLDSRDSQVCAVSPESHGRGWSVQSPQVCPPQPSSRTGHKQKPRAAGGQNNLSESTSGCC